jgi:two-component system response regulator
MQACSILLVQDNPGDAHLLKYGVELTKVPHKLYVVSHGREALDFLYRRHAHRDAPRPDLVVMDTNLPYVNGLEVVRQMKADEALLEIPVVLLSGSDTDALRAYKLHANCYVRKPSDLDMYVEAVRMIVEFWCGLVQLPS